MPKKSADEGPNFIANKVVWPCGDHNVSVSRWAYDSARALMRGEDWELIGTVYEDHGGDSCELVPSESESYELLNGILLIEQTAPSDNSRQQMVPKNTSPGDVMTPRQVAKEFPAHINTVRRWISTGKLRAHRARNGRLRILRSEFIKFQGLDSVDEES